MLPSVYGWAAVLALLIGGTILIRYWIRRGASAEAQVERETQDRLDAERKAKEHEAVANVERRDLPRGVAGGRVQSRPWKGPRTQPPSS